MVSFSGQQAEVENVDDEVLDYVQQHNADRLVQNALKLAPHGKEGVRQSLQTALKLTWRIGNPAVTRLLQDSLDDLADRGALSSGTRQLAESVSVERKHCDSSCGRQPRSSDSVGDFHRWRTVGLCASRPENGHLAA